MFSKEKNVDVIVTLFENAIQNISKALEDINEDKEKNVFETVALFFLLTDLAVVNSKKDRQQVEKLKEHIYYKYLKNNESNKKMAGRLDLYGRLVRGEKARGHWLLAGEKMIEYRDNPMMNYLLAFGDFLFFDWNSENYFNEPIKLLNPLWCMNVAATMLSKVYPYMESYFEQIYMLK